MAPVPATLRGESFQARDGSWRALAVIEATRREIMVALNEARPDGSRIYVVQDGAGWRPVQFPQQQAS